ncbi:MAG: alpha-1,6-glucosidase domain-containing protein [Telluria sp.]
MIRQRFAALLAFAAACGLAHADIPIESCAIPSMDYMQDRAVPPPVPARAVSLNRQLIKWPGADSSKLFRLYYASDMGLAAPLGQKIATDNYLELEVTPELPNRLADQFKYVEGGPVLKLRDADLERLPELLRSPLVLVEEERDGTVRAVAGVQLAGALDDIYAAAGQMKGLGATPSPNETRFAVWAPTAREAAVCVYADGNGPATGISQMQFDPSTGAWSTSVRGDLSGRYYRYALDVYVNGKGLVRNLVTDPYSVSLTTDSKRSYIANLSSPSLKPKDWDRTPSPASVKAQTDMSVYELHVRDFSINDPTVSAAHRGKYLAFTETASNGMRHLAALARAGLTDVHLLPVYDFGSVPEHGCAVPSPSGTPDGDEQQALVRKTAESDCFNWGYDPFHYNAPEGSYATDPSDGARRIVEFRQMVQSLHRAGLRVGMDVVFNHTFKAGQHEKSVLDRIVPGYYHRLDANGNIERSTCCDNTATENLMMGKLMIDSVTLWATQYKIDSFRFDLMGHQPRATMELLQKRVNAAAGRKIPLIGEGWNFGEVANGARFVQASQLSLNGSGIGTFNDRERDAVRGGSAGDAGVDMIRRQGYVNGLFYDANDKSNGTKAELMRTADMVRAGLAGSVRSYRLRTSDDRELALDAIDYNGQPAGYASQPGETVNYVENHDNQTLFDINVLKLPVATSSADRARVQVLAMAIDAFSQGVAYFHAGIDILRSKSLDRNSFNSGDWFNRVDWSYRDNYFGSGLPPADDNGKDWPLLKPLLANAAIKPAPADIAFARDAFRDLLSIRASSTLFRMRTAADISRRLRFFNAGSAQEPTVIAAHIDGRGYAGARFSGVTYLINVDKVAHTVADPLARGRKMRVHPAHVADKRALEAKFDSASGAFTVPARTAVVFAEG